MPAGFRLQLAVSFFSCFSFSRALQTIFNHETPTLFQVCERLSIASMTQNFRRKKASPCRSPSIELRSESRPLAHALRSPTQVQRSLPVAGCQVLQELARPAGGFPPRARLVSPHCGGSYPNSSTATNSRTPKRRAAERERESRPAIAKAPTNRMSPPPSQLRTCAHLRETHVEQ